VEIDVCGAGDRLDKVDNKIHQVKEMVRAVIAGPPFKLGRERIKDLIAYTVSHIKLKYTTLLTDNMCPRVKFTGVHPGYVAEFSLAFGDYVE
jgi:hypothetical protein